MSPDAPDPDPFAPIAPYYDVLMDSVPYRMWVEYVAQLAALAGRPVEPESRVLDLATGTGSVALELAARGCVVTGIDCSAPMLAEAKRKAAERHLPVSFLCRDLCDFTLPPHYDHAVCLYDSLNYILELSRLKQAFANIRGTLRPGGLLVFDVNTVHALEAELFTQKSSADAPVRYDWRSRYDPRTHTSRIKMRFHIAATGEHFTVLHHQRAYTEEELRAVLEEADFDDIRIHDAYHFSPPTERSDRVFYVALAD